MNTTKLIEQIGGRERLEFIAGDCAEARFSEIETMARALLAVLDAQENSTIRKRKALLWLERQQAANPGMNEVRYEIELLTTPPASSAPGEMTPEMMRAVQLKSELGAYAAANLGGAYGLFDEFWKVAMAAAPAPGGEK